MLLHLVPERLCPKFCQFSALFRREWPRCAAVAAHWRQGLLGLLLLFHCSPLLEPSQFPVFSLQLLRGGLCSVLRPLHRSEGLGLVSMLVSFPEGMVSCVQGKESTALPCSLCWNVFVLHPPRCCRDHQVISLWWAGRVADVDHVSSPSSQVLRCTWVLELHACSPLPEGWDLCLMWYCDFF